MLIDESSRAYQAKFFSVGNNDIKIVAQWFAARQGSHGLQGGCHTGAIVTGTRSELSCVVVRRDRHPAARRGSVFTGEDVADGRRPNHSASRKNNRCLLNLDIETQILQFSNQELPNPIVFSRTWHMGSYRDFFKQHARPRS